MRRDDFNEIEFRFFRFGGHAKGRFAVLVFATLAAMAMIATIAICYRASSVGIAYYDHLDGPQSRAMTSHLNKSMLSWPGLTRPSMETSQQVEKWMAASRAAMTD